VRSKIRDARKKVEEWKVTRPARRRAMSPKTRRSRTTVIFARQLSNPGKPARVKALAVCRRIGNR
jgi:hypothetical protein